MYFAIALSAVFFLSVSSAHGAQTLRFGSAKDEYAFANYVIKRLRTGKDVRFKAPDFPFAHNGYRYAEAEAIILLKRGLPITYMYPGGLTTYAQTCGNPAFLQALQYNQEYEQNFPRISEIYNHPQPTHAKFHHHERANRMANVKTGVAFLRTIGS